jgi:putative ABC transport system permease protein
MLILKLAWRNIWRNKRRSFLIIGAFSITLFTLLFFRGLVKGAMREGINNAVDVHYGHICISAEGFNEYPKISYSIDSATAGSIKNLLLQEKHAKSFSSRVSSQGLVNSVRSSAGVSVLGIDPDKEPSVTTIKTLIINGEYLQNNTGHDMLIGARLAKRLQVTLGDKVVLTVSTLTSQMASDAYRIRGIYETDVPEYDNRVIMIGLENAQQLFAVGDNISEIVVRLNSYLDVNTVRGKLQHILKGKNLEFITWKEALPYMAKTVEALDDYIAFNETIFLMVVFFGIVNILTMNVFERIRETGIMMAQGARPWFVFLLLVIEAGILSAVGVCVGLVFSMPAIWHLVKNGLNLSMFYAALKSWRIGNIVHFDVTGYDILALSLFLIASGILASLYPAYKASRFKPVDAIHHI